MENSNKKEKPHWISECHLWFKKPVSIHKMLIRVHVFATFGCCPLSINSKFIFTSVAWRGFIKALFWTLTFLRNDIHEWQRHFTHQWRLPVGLGIFHKLWLAQLARLHEGIQRHIISGKACSFLLARNWLCIRVKMCFEMYIECGIWVKCSHLPRMAVCVCLWHFHARLLV